MNDNRITDVVSVFGASKMGPCPTPARDSGSHFCFSSTSRCPDIVDALCCHMGTAIKHPVPYQVKSSFVIFDNRAL